jgi:hypothetical protein
MFKVTALPFDGTPSNRGFEKSNHKEDFGKETT